MLSIRIRHAVKHNSKYLVLCFVLLSLFSCSSSAPPLRYYLLHDVSHTASGTQTFERQVVLKSLILPEYLKQAGLVYQLGPAELHISQSHFWSESIDVGISRLIRKDIANDGILLTASINMSSPTQEATELSLFIDDFLPTWEGNVILAGRYEFKSNNGKTLLQHFHYTQALNDDGFEHSVLAMRSVIGSLSEDISASLKAM